MRKARKHRAIQHRRSNKQTTRKEDGVDLSPPTSPATSDTSEGGAEQTGGGKGDGKEISKRRRSSMAVAQSKSERLKTGSRSKSFRRSSSRPGMGGKKPSILDGDDDLEGVDNWSKTGDGSSGGDDGLQDDKNYPCNIITDMIQEEKRRELTVMMINPSTRKPYKKLMLFTAASERDHFVTSITRAKKVDGIRAAQREDKRAWSLEEQASFKGDLLVKMGEAEAERNFLRLCLLHGQLRDFCVKQRTNEVSGNRRVWREEGGGRSDSMMRRKWTGRWWNRAPVFM